MSDHNETRDNVSVCCECVCLCRVTPGSLGNVESWRCHLHGEAECRCCPGCDDEGVPLMFLASLTHEHEWHPMHLNLVDAEECRCGAVREVRDTNG